MQDGYVKNPKDPGGAKWTSAQDEEDFEQERLIGEWLEQSGGDDFDFKYINGKGTCRSSLIKAAVSLDAPVRHDSDATFGDFIVGSDGRDFECGENSDEVVIDFEDLMRGYLKHLGFQKGDQEWLIRTLRSSIKENRSRLEKFLTDSEW